MQPQDSAVFHNSQTPAPVYRVDDLTVDAGRVTVTRAGEPLTLPKLSFDLLLALIEAAPRVVSPDELMDRVWPGLVVGPETVSQRVKLLRESLDDDSKKPRYIMGIRGRGYRLLPSVARLSTSAEAAVESAPAVSTAPLPLQAPARGMRWRVTLTALTLAVTAVAGLWLYVDRSRHATLEEATKASVPLPPRSVAVLAFENRGGASGTPILAEGIPETVLHQLARFPGLTVIARSSSFAFRDRPQDPRVIGRKLNVRYLLEGSVQTAGQRLRVTSSLVDAESGAAVWSMQFDRAPQDIFAVQDEIAIEVARAMRLTLDAGADAAASFRQGATRSYEAYLAFMRGRALLANLRVGDLPEAMSSLTAAIRHDPKFAAAYVLLARAKIDLAERDPASSTQLNFPLAVEGAQKLLDQAIALDPKNGEAHVERGYLKAYFDLAAADADIRKGLELAPNYARGYEGLAAVLFQSVARRREALEVVEKARRLDPLEPRLDVIKANYLLWGPGDTGQAIQILESVLERDPLYVPALVRLGTLRLSFGGEFAESALLLEHAVKLDPGDETAWRQLAKAYLEVNDIAAAESALPDIGDQPPHGSLEILLARKDWRKAGEAAYAMIAAGRTTPYDERPIAFAIRMHARSTGDYARAIKALEEWALVSWDGDEPLLAGQLDMGLGVAGLADMLAAAGQRERASALAAQLLVDAEIQIGRYGRGEVWLNEARAIAMVLLDRPEDAIATLRRQSELGSLRHGWHLTLEGEPLFEALRRRNEIQALLADTRANALRERKRLDQLRADGLVPTRR